MAASARRAAACRLKCPIVHAQQSGRRAFTDDLSRRIHCTRRCTEDHIMEVKSLARVLCVLAGLIAVAGVASAQECQRGCFTQERACFGNANLAMPACKASCRATKKPTEVGACSRACTDTFTKAKLACRTRLAGCRDACIPSPIPCGGSCGQNLATCIKTVVTKQQDCIRTCKPGSGRPSCVSSCLAAANAGSAACTASFDDCHARCGGSPSGAFVDPSLMF